MDHIKPEYKTLLFYTITKNEITTSDKTFNGSSLTCVPIADFETFEEKHTFDAVVVSPAVKLPSTFLHKILSLQTSDGLCIIQRHTEEEAKVLQFNYRTSGFVNVQVQTGEDIFEVVGSKPKYEVGSSAKLNLTKKNVWKISDMGDEDVETIDPDNLLDEDDLKKPTPQSLRVCSTTGKRKACKDCSCGLADELIADGKNGETVDTTDNPKSSCGSCYLGDAFRCATCPYLGMPAFKPGEKIQLSDMQMKADL